MSDHEHSLSIVAATSTAPPMRKTSTFGGVPVHFLIFVGMVVGFLLWGLAKDQIPTSWGGEICVDIGGRMTTFLLQTNGTTLTTVLPNPGLTDLYLQVLQLDLGASDGVAFTPGLHLQF